MSRQLFVSYLFNKDQMAYWKMMLPDSADSLRE